VAGATTTSTFRVLPGRLWVPQIAAQVAVRTPGIASAAAEHRIHGTVKSTHPGLLEDADPAAESVRAITEVIASVRRGGPLPPS
jgi:hypothetical protein